MADVDLSSIKQLLEDMLKERAANAAQKIADDLTKEAKLAIEFFYDSYNPIKYSRQGGLRGTYKRYYKNPHGQIYHGGVELMPGTGNYKSSLTGEPMGADFVSALAVFNGMHGNVEAFPFAVKTIPPRMSPSPYEIVEKKRQFILMNIYNYVN